MKTSPLRHPCPHFDHPRHLEHQQFTLNLSLVVELYHMTNLSECFIHPSPFSQTRAAFIMSSNFNSFSSAAPSDPCCYNALFSQPGVDETVGAVSFFDSDTWDTSRVNEIDKVSEKMEFSLGAETCSFREPPSYSDFALEEPFLASEPSDAPILRNFAEPSPTNPCSLNDETFTLEPEQNWQTIAACSYDATCLDPIAVDLSMIDSPGINSDHQPMFIDVAAKEVTPLHRADMLQGDNLLQFTSTNLPRSKRTRISNVAKDMLMKHFRQNP